MRYRLYSDYGFYHDLKTCLKHWQDTFRPNLREVDFGELPLMPGWDEKAAEEVAAQSMAEMTALLQWLDAHPRAKAVGWRNGKTVSLRCLKLLTLGALAAAKADESIRPAYWTHLYEHGVWLARYPTPSLPARHGLMLEAVAQYLLGALCIEIPEAEAWKEAGWRRIQTVAGIIYTEDGVGIERSLHYSALTMEALLLALSVAANLKQPALEPPKSHMLTAAGWLRACIDRGGNVPFIGETDGASIIGDTADYIPSLLACIAPLLDAPALNPSVVPTHIRNRLFASGNVPHKGEEGIKGFEHGGYITGRHDAGGHELLVVVSHNACNVGTHADTLSLLLHMDGMPILVDSGSPGNKADATWREYFRSPAAHNTLIVEDKSYVHAKATLTTLETGSEHWQVDMSHDGYVPAFGVQHRRRVSVTPKRGIAVEDALAGTAARHVAIHFQFHPELTIRREDTLLVVEKQKKALLRIMHLSPLACHIANAGEPGSGWYEDYTGRKSAGRIVFSGILPSNAKAVTDFAFVWI